MLEEANRILDIGISDGLGQYWSKHYDILSSEKYLGIEPSEERANEARKRRLNVVVTDFFDFESEELFDIVMAHEIIAHIKEENWSTFFERMKQFTKPGGYVIVSTVINQKEEGYVLPEGFDEFQRHVTFDINLEKIQKYLPNATEKKISGWYLFRTPGESWIWASVRWIKRILTRHPYVGKWGLPESGNAIYFYKKP